MSSSINWDEVIDKKARGIDDYDLGEVQEVNDNVVITQKAVQLMLMSESTENLDKAQKNQKRVGASRIRS